MSIYRLCVLCFLMISILSISSTVSPQDKWRVAIMPFENLSKSTGDAQLETLTDGMAESLIAGLTRINSIILIERSQIKRILKEQALGQTSAIDPDTVPKVGKLLGANYVILGSFQVIGDQIKIISRITDAETGIIDSTKVVSVRGKWRDDVFDLQDELSRMFLDKFNIHYSDIEKDRMTKIFKSTSSYTAYDYYIKGRNEYDKSIYQGYSNSIHLFNKALEVDRDYALAYCGLSQSYSRLSWLNSHYYGGDYKSDNSNAISSAKKAIELSPHLAEAHKALAHAYNNAYPDFSYYRKVRAELKKSIKLNPNDAEAYYLLWLAYGMKMRSDYIKKIISINPKYDRVHNSLGIVYARKKKYAKSSEYFQKAIDLNPINHEYYFNLACISSIQGFTTKAINLLVKALDRSADDITKKVIIKQIKSDPDLKKIRKTNEYKALLKKHN